VLSSDSLLNDEPCRQSDVVSLHPRQWPDTAGFIGEREFGLMKPTAIFVNTALRPGLGFGGAPALRCTLGSLA
jgi:hypothetical protein